MSACRSRQQAIVLLAASSGTFLLFLYIFSDSLSSNRPHNYWGSKSGGSRSQSPGSSSASAPIPPPSEQKTYDCSDPYRQPGYLYIDRNDYHNTQWIPYTSDLIEQVDSESATYPHAPDSPDLYFDYSPPSPSVLESPSNPTPWMKLAVAEATRRRHTVTTPALPIEKQTASDYAALQTSGDLAWLWGRRLLNIGDSVDRFLTQYFCDEFSRPLQAGSLGPRTTAHCHIPELNVTLSQWHFAGSFPYRPAWWWMPDMELVAFEDRFARYWRPTIGAHVAGANGVAPDLVLWQSGLWDQRALVEAAEAHFGKKAAANDTDEPVMGSRERQLAWDEVRFLVARAKSFVAFLADTFPDTPTMFRAVNLHRVSEASDANLYEIERIGRAVAARAGHEMFEWARIVSAFGWLYSDRTHPAKGPATWLWGNMALDSLARVAAKGGRPYFDGWGACHEQLVQWGGR